jgi:hypothetical protein
MAADAPSGSFDYAPLVLARNCLSRRFAQDDSSEGLSSDYRQYYSVAIIEQIDDQMVKKSRLNCRRCAFS